MLQRYSFTGNQRSMWKQISDMGLYVFKILKTVEVKWIMESNQIKNYQSDLRIWMIETQFVPVHDRRYGDVCCGTCVIKWILLACHIFKCTVIYLELPSDKTFFPYFRI